MSRIRLLVLLCLLPLLLAAFGLSRSTREAGGTPDFDAMQASTANVGIGGSGVFVRTPQGLYVWTAGHVVAGFRERALLEGDDGEKIPVLTVTGVEVEAEVIDFAGEADLALLRLDDQGLDVVGALAAPSAPLRLGAPVYFCGSSRGRMGIGTLTSGIVSYIGRLSDVGVLDQCSAPTYPGASGGGVFDHLGHHAGVVVGGAGETFSLFVPMRCVEDWARNRGLQWAVVRERDAWRALRLMPGRGEE